VQVSAQALDQLCQDVARGLSGAEVMRRLAAWRCEPVAVPLQRLADHARALARRLGKEDPVVEVAAPGLSLDRQRWSALWAELVHLVNNAVDHGFDSAEERHRAGKPARPHLRLAARSEGSSLLIEITDDGRGIDWDRVRQVAAERALPAETAAQCSEALFTPGFSTQSQITATSGRGIGLSAVRARVDQRHGTITVDSQRGSGTTWRLSFPLTELAAHESVELVESQGLRR
jgi:two-component system chemotaxis sensor kinase CheA